MARTPAFRALKRALRRSLFLQSHPEFREVDFLERREFLKRSLQYGAAVVPLSALVANCATAPKSSAGALARDGDHLPVAIVGGGLAGMTAAYRLSRAGIACGVFEAQSRLGGRVFTRDRFNDEGMFCELGGELIDSDHGEILALAKELGVATDDFRPGDAKVKHHQFFFGGKRYYDDELTAACGPLAERLAKDMKALFGERRDGNPGTPGGDDAVVTYDHHTPAAEKFDRISLEEYLQQSRDVDAWVRDSINVAYLTEFGLDAGDQSCINLMMLIDPNPAHGFGIFGASDEALRIHGGNSRLVEALAGAVRGRADVHFEHRLVRIEDRGSSVALTFVEGSRSRTITAEHVICTIPFTLLRDVEGLEALSPVKRRCIAELGYGQNTKRMLGFKSRRWRHKHGAVPAASGYTFTDLPSQTLWDTSRGQPGRSGIITTFMGGSMGANPSSGAVESILADLEKICPGSRALYDGNDALMRWPAQPFFKGSYTCPKVGQYTTLIGSAKESELNGKLLFAGEHVSEKYQGYMNGAVQTGGWAAQAIIGKRRARVVAPLAAAGALVEG